MPTRQQTICERALDQGRKAEFIQNVLHVLRFGLPGDDMRLFTEDLRDDRAEYIAATEAIMQQAIAQGLPEPVAVAMVDALATLGAHDAIYSLALAAYISAPPARQLLEAAGRSA